MGLTSIASRLIKKYGQTGILLQAGEGASNGLGGRDRGPETAHPVTLVQANYTTELEALRGSLLTTGEQRVLISVEDLSVEPKTGDRLLIGGNRFEARRVAPLAPSGEILFWEVEVKDV